jgi:hypothetical protein
LVIVSLLTDGRFIQSSISERGKPLWAAGRDAIILEKKEDMKRRGLASPDDGDALAFDGRHRIMAFPGVISQPPYRPNPDEVATIVAADHRFDDWESVFVQHRWADAYAWFRFTTAERESDPPSFDWRTLRLKPPDPVAIYLGGQLAINGLITSRQTAYEGNNHAVQLEGKGLTWEGVSQRLK